MAKGLTKVGVTVGCEDGFIVGSNDGRALGTSDGFVDGSVGLLEG